VILASHFQLALLEMERRSVSPRAGRERVRRDHLEGVKYRDRRRVVPAPPKLLHEFTNSRGRASERANERARCFLLT